MHFKEMEIPVHFLLNTSAHRSLSRHQYLFTIFFVEVKFKSKETYLDCTFAVLTHVNTCVPQTPIKLLCTDFQLLAVVLLFGRKAVRVCWLLSRWHNTWPASSIACCIEACPGGEPRLSSQRNCHVTTGENVAQRLSLCIWKLKIWGFLGGSEV